MSMIVGDDNPLGALIGKNAAERALQPWWEGIQDLLIYGLIGFGIVAFPTAMVNKDENILKCTPCGTDYCPTDFEDAFAEGFFFSYGIDETTEVNNETSSAMLKDLNLSSQMQEFINDDWVNAYCLVSDLGMQVQYFPFIILLMAISLCLVQKVANTVFDSNDNLDMFYRLLTSSVLDTSKKNKMVDKEFLSECSKLCIQIRHSYESSEKLYRAYVSRNVMLTVVATLEFGYFLGLCLPALSKSVYFKCQIGPLHYDCTGHPGQFYVLLSSFTVLIMAVFLACCVLNLTWTVASTKYCEMYRTMGELMKKLRLMQKMGLRKGDTDAELLGEVVHKIFYRNKDLNLLLVLLASASGIANTFFLMVLFDEDFREEMQVGGIDIRGSTQKKYAVEVRVRDEHSVMKAVLNSLNGIDIMYIVEIKPPLSRNSVFVMPVEPLEDIPVDSSLLPSDDPDAAHTSLLTEKEQLIKSTSKFYTTKLLSPVNSTHEEDPKITFDDLDPGTSYTITVNTIMNGIEIASKEAKIYQMGN